MASSSSHRGYQQDYIARIRYSNQLPPPPNPPKLLDIPNTGLASGQYTTPGFAGRLARNEPLNIEADAELGMPLDLVGMPGIFDGDESSIQAPLIIPAPHPHDRALLRPLSSLGKPKLSDAGVSFLRRTEYISSYTSRSKFESTTSRSLVNSTGGRFSKKVVNLDKESPEYIKDQVEKSFDIAAQHLRNTSLVRHPTKRNLKLVEAHPFLPDHEAFPDPGGYVHLKFTTNPVPPSTTYDVRVDHAIVKPLDRTPEAEAAMAEALELHTRNPEQYPAPDKTVEYDFFLADQGASEALKLKRKFDTTAEDKDSDDLYTIKNNSGEKCFRYKRIRAYESALVSGSLAEKYEDTVVLAVHDGSDGLRQKAAYYYPIVQHISIRPQRTKNINVRKLAYGPQGTQEEEVESVDFADVRILEPTQYLQKSRDKFRDAPFSQPDEDLGAEAETTEVQNDGSSSPGGNDGE